MAHDRFPLDASMLLVAAFADVVDAALDLAELVHLGDAIAVLVAGQWSADVVRADPGLWAVGARVAAVDPELTGHTHEAVLALGAVTLRLDLGVIGAPPAAAATPARAAS